MQVFVKVDGQIIDVSKITHMVIGRGDSMSVHFTGGTQTRLTSGVAARLLEAMRQLGGDRVIVTRVAPENA